MGQVISLDDKRNERFGYIVDDTDKVTHIAYRGLEGDISIGLDGGLFVDADGISPDDLKHLFMMWLAMHDPSRVNFDDDYLTDTQLGPEVANDAST